MMIANPVVNQRLLEAEEAAQKAASGEWSPEEFEDFIEELSQALQKREEDIRQIEIPPEAVEDFPGRTRSWLQRHPTLA